MNLKDALKLAESVLTAEKDGEGFDNVTLKCDKDDHYSVEVEFSWLNKEQVQLLCVVLMNFPALIFTIEDKTITIFEPIEDEPQ